MDSYNTTVVKLKTATCCWHLFSQSLHKRWHCESLTCLIDMVYSNSWPWINNALQHLMTMATFYQKCKHRKLCYFWWQKWGWSSKLISAETFLLKKVSQWFLQSWLITKLITKLMYDQYTLYIWCHVFKYKRPRSLK